MLAAYDGHIVNVGRIVTDSSFHHFLDLNLLGDPCSTNDATNVKLQGFNGSTSGKAVLNELKAFYVNLASWLAWNDRKFYFGFGKNNYGRDEVQDNPNYPTAFYLFLEGFTPNVVGSSPIITFSGSFFTDIPGLSISGPKAVVYDIGNTGANATVSQRIRFEYEVQFTNASLELLQPPSHQPAAQHPTLTLSTLLSTYKEQSFRACQRSSSCWAVTIHTSRTSMRAPATSLTSAKIFGCSRSLPQRTSRRQSATCIHIPERQSDHVRSPRRLYLYPGADHLAQSDLRLSEHKLHAARHQRLRSSE